MKFLVAFLFLVAYTQAADWANVRPICRTMPVLRPVSRPAKIIGGNVASTGQFKYQVAVLVDGSGFCGGSLILSDVVLTAAHCLDGGSSWEIHAGALDYFDELEPGRVIVSSTDAIMHENFDAATVDNDIGLIKLPMFISGPNIERVRLPSRTQAADNFAGTIARLTGWGTTSDDFSSINPYLKYADLEIIRNRDCKVVYGDVINANKLCVDTAGGLVSSCRGDSGGPLIIMEIDGVPTEVGVASFVSSDGCESGAPAVFARVTEYLDWLETNAGVTIRP